MNRLRPAINPRPQYREVIPARFLIANIVVAVIFLAALDFAMPGKSFAAHVAAAIWSAIQ